jgi:hypothetical protein
MALEGIGAGWGWLWLLFIVAGAAFLYWTYLGIFQRTEHRLTWSLMLLRGAGLMLLVLALAKPIWTRESDTVTPGRLAVILDNSWSMSLPEANGEPRYTRARKAAMVVKELESSSDPRMVVDFFDIDGAPLKDGIPAEPTVTHTNLGKAIQSTLSRERSELLLGVVVISDGVDNSGRKNFGDWADTSHPIFGLGFPRTESGDLDLAVRSTQAPQRVHVQNEVPVKVMVAKSGTGEAKARVSVRLGKEELASKDVAFGPGEQQQEVELRFVPHDPGSFVLTAAVASAAGAKERDLGNNAEYFPLRVVGEPIKVFYLEGFLRYEYKYLKERLEDDPDVELRSYVRREAPEASTSAVKDFPVKTKDKDMLDDFDVVILGDMEGSYLTKDECERLKEWVGKKNHSLLFLGGYHALGPDGLVKTALAEVLPLVPAEGATQVEGQFQLKLTAEGKSHQPFTLTQDRIKDPQAWEESIPLLGMTRTAAVPTAIVLAVHPKEQVDGKLAPVLAVRSIGAGGHVMALAVDSTWQWAREARLKGQPDLLYSRFWSQEVRWLAGRSLDDNRPDLTVTTDKTSYAIGNKVKVIVRRQPKPQAAQSTTEPRVKFHDPAGQAIAVPLVKDSADPDKFTGEYFPSVSGRHEVEATLEAAQDNLGKKAANAVTEFPVQGKAVELADVGTRPDNLAALAKATGGVYLEVDQAAEVEKLIKREERSRVEAKSSEYWNSPWLFLGFLGLVTGEWFLRRKYHLV